MVDSGGAVVGHFQTVVLVVLHGTGCVGGELQRHVTGVRTVRAFRKRQRGLRLALQHHRFCYIAWGTT